MKRTIFVLTIFIGGVAFGSVGIGLAILAPVLVVGVLTDGNWWWMFLTLVFVWAPLCVVWGSIMERLVSSGDPADADRERYCALYRDGPVGRNAPRE